MKKIAIVELYGHYEVLYSFCIALKSFKLLIFTTDIGWSDAPPRIKASIGANVFVKAPKESIPCFVNANKTVLDSCSLILFSTLTGDYRYFAKQKWKAKTMLIIHNGNFWLNYRKALQVMSILDIFRWLRAEWKREWYHRKQILSKIDFISFPNLLIHNHFLENGHTKKLKVFPPLPFYTLQSIEKKSKKKDEIIIVIPGALSDGTRNYEMVLNAFGKTITKLGADILINLVLLGLPKKKYGLELQKKFKRMETQMLKITIFSEYIPQKEYDRWVAKADFLILPLLRNMNYGICQETGGFSKISGTVNDMLRFRVPSLIPSFYPLSIDGCSLVKKFGSSEEFTKLIACWILNKTYEKVRREYPYARIKNLNTEDGKKLYSSISEILN